MSPSQLCRGKVLLLLATLFLGVGCNRAENAEHPTGDDPENLTDDSANTVAAQPGATVDSLAAGPDTLAAEKRGLLHIEGMQDKITLKLFRTPESFHIPFHTYYPEELTAAIIPSDISETVRFTANFGGRLTNDAYVEFFYYPGVLTDEDLRVVVQEKANNLGAVAGAPKRYTWSLAEYPFQGERLIGRYITGVHNGQYFHLLIASPLEMAEGLGSRADIILSEWRWADTGAPLGR